MVSRIGEYEGSRNSSLACLLVPRKPVFGHELSLLSSGCPRPECRHTCTCSEVHLFACSLHVWASGVPLTACTCKALSLDWAQKRALLFRGK